MKMKNLKDVKSPHARALWLEIYEVYVMRTSREQFIKHMSAIRRKYDDIYGAGASERDLDLVPLPTLTEVIDAQVSTAIAALAEPEPRKTLTDFERVTFQMFAQCALGDEERA